MNVGVIAGVAVLAGLVPGAAPAQASEAFVGIPGIRFVFYDVTGADPAAIRAAIDAARPEDPRDRATSYDAATDWTMRWRWRVDARGRCDLSTTRVTFAATVTLPRLTGVVADSVQAAWDRYRAALDRHEAAHARYAYDHRGEVAAAIAGATCATADAAAQDALRRIVAHDRAYDVATRHGQEEGAVFP